RPEGSDLIEDWYVYWALAKRLGIQLVYCGVRLDMEKTPHTEELLEIRLANSPLTLADLKEDLKNNPAGRIYDPPSAIVQQARAGANGKFDVMPSDVAAEVQDFLGTVLARDAAPEPGFSYLLISRRMNNVMN